MSEKFKRYITRCAILLFLPAAAVLTGCENNSHTDSFEAAEDTEYNGADTKDKEADPEDDMASLQESEVLNDSEKPDIEKDIDLSATEIYERFLNGELTVEQKKEQVYISELFWDNDIEYCFGDVDGDGDEELHIRDSVAYYTIKAEGGTPRIIFEGWMYYEPVVTDELCGILYYSSGYASEWIDFMNKPDSTTLVSEYCEAEYSLIYVDNDDIPELYINTDYGAGGEFIVSFYDGKVRAMNRTRTGGIKYMEYGGLLYSSSGNAGFYPCNIYMLEKGEFSEIGTGWWSDHYDEELETSKCIEPSVLYTKDEILEILGQ